MTHAIWKYKVSTGWHEMPDGAIVRHLDWQDGEGYMWVEVNPDAPLVKRYFNVVGTRSIIPDNTTYVGTLVGPVLVHHVIEVFARDDDR